MHHSNSERITSEESPEAAVQELQAVCVLDNSTGCKRDLQPVTCGLEFTNSGRAGVQDAIDPSTEVYCCYHEVQVSCF